MEKDTTDRGSVQNVKVVLRCPACGAEDYEEEFDETELLSMIEFPCEECDKTIVVSVDVTVQAVVRDEWQDARQAVSRVG